MLAFPDENENQGSDSGYNFDYGENEKVNQDKVGETDRELFSAEEPQAQFNTGAGPAEKERRLNLIEEARKIMRRGADKAPGRLATRVGMSKDAQKALRADTPENRAKVKEEARKKARKFAKDKIAKKIADRGVAAGFKKGLSREAGAVAKEGAKRAGKQAVKSAGKALGKGAAQGAAKVATTVGTEAVTGVAAASGFATFGLGFILSFLLNIAITLGINDAVDAGFELAGGNIKQATFLAIRAAAKVGVFIYLVITLCFMISVGGIFIGIPLLILLNIYMIAGMIFKKLPNLQGVVWWEMAIIIIMDIIAFLIVAAFIGALGWYLCTSSGLGSGGVTGAVAGAVASAYDWWNSSSAGSVAAEFCKFVQQGSAGTGGDFSGGGAGGNF